MAQGKHSVVSGFSVNLRTELGSGTFGRVYAGKDSTGRHVAVKHVTGFQDDDMRKFAQNALRFKVNEMN